MERMTRFRGQKNPNNGLILHGEMEISHRVNENVNLNTYSKGKFKMSGSEADVQIVMLQINVQLR
jgi:hypothetical protein